MVEIKFEDLVKKCEECEGSGNPDDKGTSDDFSELGRRSAYKMCDCKGHGGKPTPTGELIRGFVAWLNRTGQLPGLS